MNHLRRLVHEIHRRSLWQVMGIFLAASWGVIEVVSLLTEQVGLPSWTPTMALVLLLIGLPVVLATAFVQEGMPGQRGDEPSVTKVDGPQPANLAAGTGSLDRPSTRPSAPRRLLTWRNAVMGGVAAFALLAVSLGAWFVMWSSGIGPVGSLVAQGVIEEGERVVLADFSDRTGSGLADVVTEALRVDLQESAVLNLVPPARVSEAMTRMGLPEDSEVTSERAREVAIRDGLKAVIQGEVGALGSGYLLTASIVEPSRGNVLASFRADARDGDALLAALDRLSSDIREKAGESLRLIRAGAPLDEVTTASLEALRLYAEAVDMADRGEEMESIPLLEEALRIDPDFAMAHRKLSAVLGNLGIQPDRMRAAATRAYELRDRLSEREWLRAEGYYRLRVENNPDAAIEAWQRVLERYPGDAGARNNVGAAGLMVWRPQDAVEALRPLFGEGDRPSAINYDNLIQALWQVGEREEARSLANRLFERYPESRQALSLAHHVAAADRDWQGALERVAVELDGGAGTPGVDVLARADQAGYYHGLGLLDDADRALDLAAAAAIEHRQWEWFWGFVENMRATAEWALHHPDRGPARASLEAARSTLPLDSVDLRGDAAGRVASLYAVLGWTERADSLRGLIDQAYRPTEKGRDYQVRRQRHLLYRALGTGDAEAAAEALGRLEELAPCPSVCADRAVVGLAHELAGDDEAAVAAYEAALDTSPLYWDSYEASLLPLAFDRLGSLHEARGNADHAAEVYRRMIDAYPDAEGPIASRVADVRRRLEAIQGG